MNQIKNLTNSNFEIIKKKCFYNFQKTQFFLKNNEYGSLIP